MTLISAKAMLVTIGSILTALAVFIAAYNANVQVAVGPVDYVLGAVSTLDGVDSPYINIAGLKGFWGTRSLVASSSNICVLKNPLGVPAVIEEISLNVVTNRTQGVSFDISTSTDGFATSSVILARGALAAAATSQYAWTPKSGTTTAATSIPLVGGGNLLLENSAQDLGSTRFVLGSNEFLNVRLSTTTGGAAPLAAYSVGTCGYVLRAY